ncbi:CHD3-type chromatin-remodeling factor [Seminavis robusta]|uniref:CHD3-type chromatin-remodeling factor n=1 Tax=Seminavis robusta TaxID=568900 RepID=A0A9N8DUD9_9STRA|nr:CHD3-type chromatin-remodeling factor [Seminavis robusta]|eukprot:Sro357_g125710.1 CHD3-type chromatin-remodeling factor (718) ;mRNA; f:53006-55623
MSSSLGAMSSLVSLFGLLGIPKGDKKQLQQQHGIDTPSRLNSWEHSLALKILRARSHCQQLVPTTKAAPRKPKEASKLVPLQDQKGFRQGDKYWEDVQHGNPNAKDTLDEGFTAAILGPDDKGWEEDLDNQEVFIPDPSRQDTALLRLPERVFKDLFNFQKVGVEWMTGLYHQESGGILGDEMGMGKTRQTLVLLLGLIHAGSIRNALIVCPKSVLDETWLKEVKKLIAFFSWKHQEPKVVMAASTLTERQRLQVLKLARNCSEQAPHLIITSYPQVQASKRGFMPGNGVGSGLGFFQVVVLDEAHRVKNPKSRLRKHLDFICKKSCKLLLTGTPILNRLEELHSLLKMAAPDEFGEWPRFRDQYARPIEASRQPSASSYEIKRGEKLVAELQEKILPYLLQRQKKDHLKSMVPPNYEFDVWTKLSPKQRSLYSEFVKDGKLLSGISNKDATCVLPAIHKLRYLCNHPLLFNHALEGDKQTIKSTLQALGKQTLVDQSPKMRVMLKLLHKWRSDGLKVLVFSHSVKMLNIIEFVLAGTEGIQVCRIDGSTSQKRRQQLVRDFNRIGSQYNIMLLSIEAGGEGLTLTGANKSILFDPAWTLAKSDQAVARTCRPGQTRDCETVHLLSAGTVEEKMYGKQMYKGGVEGAILANRSKGFEMRFYDKDELTKLFTLEPDDVCESLKLSLKQGSACLKKCSVNSNDKKSVVGISRRNSLKSS